jgi:hypothetical protein
MTCDGRSCKKRAVFKTKRKDALLVRNLHYCATCVAEKIAKYELEIERI